MIVSKSVQVTEVADKFMVAIQNIVAVSNEQLKDGFQAGQDLPAISVKALTELMGVLGEMKKLPEEAQKELAPFIRAIVIGAVDITEAALK